MTDSPKAVSRLMGHAKELITMDVYGDKRNIIPEEISELLAYMDEVLPEKETGGEIILDTVIDVESYQTEVEAGIVYSIPKDKIILRLCNKFGFSVEEAERLYAAYVLATV